MSADSLPTLSDVAHRGRYSASRELCKACWRPNPVGFAVTDDVWEAVVPPSLPGDVLCISCFATLADEAGVAWDEAIQLFPVSRATAEAA